MSGPNRRLSLGITLLIGGVFVLGGCARPPSAMPGAIWLNVTEAKVASTVIGPKTGQACETSILGLFTFGNSGYKAAAADGGISQIEGSDYSSKAVLGLWGQHCTLVYGR